MNAILLTLLLASGARANFVSYTDENGTKHFVQSETEIPQQYRAKAKVSTAGNPENSHPSTEGAPEAKVDAAQPAIPPKSGGETPAAPAEQPTSVRATGAIPAPAPEPSAAPSQK